MAKTRVTIPQDVAADVMFASDSTCCKCNERGKSVQIHHIDENPSNNDPANFAVLCLQCHDDTQVTGGFGRRLNAPLVIRYRDAWHARVIERRNLADQQAVAKVVGVSTAPSDVTLVVQPPEMVLTEDVKVRDEVVAELKDWEQRQREIREYVLTLPVRRAELKAIAQPEWDTGNTTRMVQASYDYIDGLEGILVALAKFYAPGSFDGDPQRFFAERVAQSFTWHRSHLEPNGPGTGGTIVNVECCGDVMSDVEDMINDVAMSLIGYDDAFDHELWRAKW